MKLLFKILLLVVLVLIVVLVGVMIYLDAIVKSSVERGATLALGVETRLDSADLEVLGGQVELDGLKVSNPEGFEAEHFLTLDESEVLVSVGSLRQEIVRVPKIQLDDLHVWLERRDGQANYQVIMDNLGRFRGPGAEPASEDEAAKRYIIDELAINGAKVNVQLLPVGGSLTTAEIDLPTIRVTDIGNEDGKGVRLSELSGIVVQAVLESIAQTSDARLPASIMNELDSGLSALGNLGELGLGALEDLKGDAGNRLEQMGRDITEKSGAAMEGAGEKASEATGKALEGAGRFLEGIGGKLQNGEGEEDAPAESAEPAAPAEPTE